jgi:hypothetical protein
MNDFKIADRLERFRIPYHEAELGLFAGLEHRRLR